MFRQTIRIIAILFIFLFVYGCSSSEEKEEGSSSSSEGPLCLLQKNSSSFVCNLNFPVLQGHKCSESVSDPVRTEFLSRMTRISIEMLYLDGEKGALPPFYYRDSTKVKANILVEECRLNAARCDCRLRYSDPNLSEIFYDSAGCRPGSSYANNPLYFKGRGCGR